MGLIKCPEKEISVEKQRAEQKKIFIMICIAILCILIVVLILGIPIIKKKTAVSNARKYLSEQKYIRAMYTLEKYKNDLDVEKLYIEVENMLSDEDKFLLDLAKGITERNNDGSATGVNAELEQIIKYEDVTFKEDVFNDKVHGYICAVNKELLALNYQKLPEYNEQWSANYDDYFITEDMVDKYNHLWNEAHSERENILQYFLDEYPYEIIMYTSKDTDARSISQTNIHSLSEAEGAVTLENYNKIQRGMTYEQVVNILGANGTRHSSIEVDGIKISGCGWYGSSGTPYIFVVFQNGEAFTKSQLGLQQ